MPPKDPGLLAYFLGWAIEHQPALYGLSLCMITSALRIIYTGGKVRRALIEAALCGAISLTLMSGMGWAGVPADASGFIGGAVGFLGVEKIRSVAERLINKRVGDLNA